MVSLRVTRGSDTRTTSGSGFGDLKKDSSREQEGPLLRHPDDVREEVLERSGADPVWKHPIRVPPKVYGM